MGLPSEKQSSPDDWNSESPALESTDAGERDGTNPEVSWLPGVLRPSSQPSTQISSHLLLGRSTPRGDATLGSATSGLFNARPANLSARSSLSESLNMMAEILHVDCSPQMRALRTRVGLQQLMLHATGSPLVEEGLLELRRRWALEPSMTQLIEQLWRESCRGAAAPAAVTAFHDVTWVHSTLDAVLSWFLKRAHALARLEQQRASSRGSYGESIEQRAPYEPPPDPAALLPLASLSSQMSPTEWSGVHTFAEERSDTLFNVRVTHDETMVGLVGMRVQVSAVLRGRNNQPVWVRLQLLHEGRPVLVRPGYELWADGDEPEVSQRNPELRPEWQNVKRAPRGSVYALSQVLRTTLQVALIESVEFFVPYRAMDIPMGNREIELAFTLLDEYGFPVCEQSRLEHVSVPSVKASVVQGSTIEAVRSEVDVEGAPSPYALGYAPYDYESGAAVRIQSVVSGIGESGVPELKLSFDLTLGEVQSAHPDDSAWSVEVRVVDRSGVPFTAHASNRSARLWEGTSTRGQAARELLWREPVGRSVPFSKWRDLSVIAPLTGFDIGELRTASGCFVEITLVGSDGRLRCGALSPLPQLPAGKEVLAAISSRPRSNTLSQPVGVRSSPLRHQQSHVRLESFAVRVVADESKYFGAPALVASTKFSSVPRGGDTVVASFALVSTEGLQLGAQEFIVSLDERASSGELSAVFPVHEIFNYLSAPASASLPCMIRLIVRSLDGRELLSEEQTMEVPATASEIRASGPQSTSDRKSTRADARIVSGEWIEQTPHLGAYVRYLINLPEDFASGPHAAKLYAEFLDESGSPLGLNGQRAGEGSALPGRLVSLAVSPVSQTAQHQASRTPAGALLLRQVAGVLDVPARQNSRVVSYHDKLGAAAETVEVPRAAEATSAKLTLYSSEGRVLDVATIVCPTIFPTGNGAAHNSSHQRSRTAPRSLPAKSASLWNRLRRWVTRVRVVSRA